jgi:hypothetical protein
MKKHNIKLSLALAAMFSSSLAFAEAELTGEIIHESAVFTQSGQSIGATTTRNQTTDTHGKDYFKGATHAKIFLDGEIEDSDATYHAELNAFIDVANRSVQDGGETYTQRDLLREAYIDQEIEGVSFRVGKQQVVWGTADGMKLLDAINPTDYTEMAQNQMEDSRIPIWMINAEKNYDDSGNFQFILSEAKSNRISGLGQASSAATSHTNGEAGDAFIMKGVDSITGKVNGFVNIAPALGAVANFFVDAAHSSGNPDNGLKHFTGAVVNDFAGENNSTAVLAFSGLCAASSNTSQADGSTNNACLYGLANDSGATDVAGYNSAVKGGNGDVTNLIESSTSNWDEANPNTVFEYMDRATFATFSSFQNLTSEYKVDHPSKASANFGVRYKNSLDNGLNYSLNYMNSYDTNPHVNIGWTDEDGKAYTPYYSVTSTGCGTNGTCTTTNGTNKTTVTLKDSDGNTVWGNSKTARLVFTEKLSRIQNLGGSFDTAIETEKLGAIIIRGEGLYQKDVKTPVVSKAALRIGDLSGGLTSENADYFKYVLGVDITALTNMMVSAQFIQIANLDYIDETHTPVGAGGTSSSVSGARYTGDAATLHLSNGLNKAEEFKEFYSLFLSKPFGASNQHRWNNLFMFEENGGKWNRLDAEFAINDDLEATVEYNKYFGDVNTQFGQLEKASNLQIGFNYSF